MTSADRETFFRRRVLSKLFPSEEETDSENDEDTTKQLYSPVGTESEDLHDMASKGQKRKLGEHDGRNLAPNDDVSLHNHEEKTSPYSPQLHAVEKPVLSSSPRSLRVSQDLSAAHETLYQSSAKECEEQAARHTGSQLTAESTEQTSKLSKNQKRKLKKKRHKERVRSSGDKQTTPAPKEFTYETG